MLGTPISAEQYKELLRQPDEQWLTFPVDYASKYNKVPFLVQHRLAEHPKLQLPELFALCRRMRSQVAFRFGVIPKDADFDSAVEKFKGNLTLDDAIDHLEAKQAYIMVYNPERDPEYRPVIEGILGEIARRTDALDPFMTWYSTYFFISAHDSLTPYHMDREMNFLLQVHGLKTVRLWDPGDDEVMTPAQKDKLLSYTGEARPAYHEKLDAKARVYELTPGTGVHHPFIAPHLVKTASQVSVSLAVTFRTRKSNTWTAAHRFNHGLRGLGLNPRPVGESAALDAAKAGLMQGVRRARSLFRKREQVA